MLTIVMAIVWLTFGGYTLWFATSAEHNVPLTVDEAKLLWKIHKKSANCASHKWHLITRRGGKISGFKCECGYKYTQKRPIVSSLPSVSD
jgi:hypothetical protein